MYIRWICINDICLSRLYTYTYIIGHRNKTLIHLALLSGGGVGLVYSGWLGNHKEAVALKTLFDPRVDEAIKQDFMDELLIHRYVVIYIGIANHSSPTNIHITLFLVSVCPTNQSYPYSHTYTTTVNSIIPISSA